MEAELELSQSAHARGRLTCDGSANETLFACLFWVSLRRVLSPVASKLPRRRQVIPRIGDKKSSKALKCDFVFFP